ncbi:MAG: cation:proton antiporter [Candidatus Geothermarchaeales archaeon]
MADPSGQIINVGQIVLILLLGVVGARLSHRLNLPIVIPLFTAGYLVGPEVLDIFDPAALGLTLSALLVLAIPPILFSEGLYIEIELFRQIGRAVFSLATVGVVISTLGIGLTAYVLFGFDIITALLLGAVLGATSPAVVISITKHLRIDRRIATIVETESAFNDATSITLTTVLASIPLAIALGVDALTPLGAAELFVRLFFGGLLIGLSVAYLSIKILEQFYLDEYYIILSLVMFFIAYSVSEVFETSGFTAVIAAGILFGMHLREQGRSFLRQDILDFWSNTTFLAQTVIFLVLGAGFSVAALSQSWFQGVIIAVVLFFAMRPLSVYVSTAAERYLNGKEKFFISWVGARAAIPAALAANLVALNVPMASEIFNIVLVVVLASIVTVSFSAKRVAKAMLEISSTPPELEKYSRAQARSHGIRKVMDELDRRFRQGFLTKKLYQELREEREQALNAVEDEMVELYLTQEVTQARMRETERLRREMVQVELDAIESLRSRGEIPPGIYRSLRSEIIKAPRRRPPLGERIELEEKIDQEEPPA